MRIQSTRYRATTLCAVGILVAMMCLPGISEARTQGPIANNSGEVSIYQTGSQVESGQSSTSLAEVLNPDGTLNLPRGFNGSPRSDRVHISVRAKGRAALYALTGERGRGQSD